MFCRNTRGALQKYWKVFCKISEGSSTLWHKMNNFLVKTQELGLFPVTSWPPIFEDRKVISNHWERSQLHIFDTYWNMKKVIRRQFLWFVNMKKCNTWPVKKRNRWRQCIEWPSPPFCHFLLSFLATLSPLPPGYVIYALFW